MTTADTTDIASPVVFQDRDHDIPPQVALIQALNEDGTVDLLVASVAHDYGVSWHLRGHVKHRADAEPNESYWV